MYNQIVVSVFFIPHFLTLAVFFAMFVKYLCNEGTSSYTFGINTLSIQLSNFWIRLALGKVGYCENILTYNKSHINSKYAMDFFLNLYKKSDRN